MEPIEDFLKKELIEIWTEKFPKVFEKGHICSEGAMQAELYHMLLPFCIKHELLMFVQPTVNKEFLYGKRTSRKDNSYKPDLVIVTGNEVTENKVIAIMELKKAHGKKFKKESKSKKDSISSDLKKLKEFRDSEKLKLSGVPLIKHHPEKSQLSTRFTLSEKLITCLIAISEEARGNFFHRIKEYEAEIGSSSDDYLILYGEIQKPGLLKV